MFTRSASEPAFLLRITLPRCAFTVISLMPSSPRHDLLQIETTEVRKAHVEHEAARRQGSRARQELPRGRECLGLPACATAQQFQRFAH